MGFDDICNTGLVLGLGFSSSSTTTTATATATATDHHLQKKQRNSSVLTMNFEPSLTLSLSGEINYEKRAVVVDHDDDHLLCRQDSAASSFSNVSVKREREIVVTTSEDVETTTDQKGLSRVISDEDDDGVNGRKKLRLTKAQSAFLEESFKVHSTLNPKQKQDLARELHLRPRQVEVWFQNRRARTKLKQTEVDCEFLKKCCESLTDENRRLQKELQELKAFKLSTAAAAQPFYMQLPAATLTMCPSCERIVGGGGTTDQNNSKNNTFNNIAPKPHHLFNPFTNPSAAC